MMESPASLEPLIDALKLRQLPVDQQEKMLIELNALVFQGSITRMIEQMEESTRAAFKKLVESDASEKELQLFLAENVPQAGQAVADTIAAMTSDILAGTSNK